MLELKNPPLPEDIIHAKVNHLRNQVIKFEKYAEEAGSPQEHAYFKDQIYKAKRDLEVVQDELRQYYNAYYLAKNPQTLYGEYTPPEFEKLAKRVTGLGPAYSEPNPTKSEKENTMTNSRDELINLIDLNNGVQTVACRYDKLSGDSPKFHGYTFKCHAELHAALSVGDPVVVTSTSEGLNLGSSSRTEIGTAPSGIT